MKVQDPDASGDSIPGDDIMLVERANSRARRGKTGILSSSDEQRRLYGKALQGWKEQGYLFNNWQEKEIVKAECANSEIFVPVVGSRIDRQRETDCSRCKLRRIQCDRTLPTCRKCKSRNFACPGYGPVFKWVQGVASRGRLSGRSIPVPLDAEKGPVKNAIFRPLSTQLQGDEWPGPTAYIQVNTPGVTLLSYLLQHFDKHVATKLAWVDGPDNPWRNIVMRLTHTSQLVLNSVLAMASEDLVLRYETGTPHVRRLQAASLEYRSKTVSLLGQQLNSLPRKALESPCSLEKARCILASILLLYNVELLTAESARWQVHIQGAGAVIQWMSQALCRPSLDNQADVFLLYEYYYHSVVMGLTTFDPPAEFTNHINTYDSLTVFSEFVQIMHTVTRAEREQYAGSPNATTPALEDITQAIVAARSRTLLLSQRINFRSLEAQRDFDHLASMYYYASLIYSHRVLGKGPSAERCIITSRDAVLDHLSRLTEGACFAHDLVWPLFIAGTECRGCPAEQAMVEGAMLAVIRISGRLDRNRVLSFLKTYWAMELEPGTTWINLVRSRAAQSRFLIM
ncbi:Zn(II)2Cys6 transcription factor [Aspergillus homomorphus CBS 101889]|uniref:Zn(2)-C6 fungal-type domain-containing protein n=1 Tax=Aspergillus homomorphus (strain CBS 101889) TaxID=1450537 RepID=A0A395HZC3_ASPHC|nr:hypothetical protein BO97DRAFT_433799 [Aspergillus homomorphus CBS 101889]RAL13047.1 hypothetical protein BO97DRAFT_433799 [Aspergillus homomorphus CBS 101889]